MGYTETGDRDRHEFQFRDCGLLNRELIRVSRYFRLSKSEMIVKILNLNIALLEKNHLKRKEQDSRYMLIKSYEPGRKTIHPGDAELPGRVSIHCYMPVLMYRRLKQLHCDLNFYSIVQLVREVIRFFLWLFERYGCDVFRVFEMLLRIEKNYNKRKCESRNPEVRQYSRNSHLTVNKVHLYSSTFKLIDRYFT